MDATIGSGAFKAAYDRVLAKDPQLLDTVIRAGLKGQPKARNAVPFLELGAKLGKEIGAGRDAVDTQPPEEARRLVRVLRAPCPGTYLRC